MKIDKEYATQLMDEVKWLSNHGIKYTFVKSKLKKKLQYINTRKRQSYLIVWRFFIVKNREENIE